MSLQLTQVSSGRMSERARSHRTILWVSIPASAFWPQWRGHLRGRIPATGAGGRTRSMDARGMPPGRCPEEPASPSCTAADATWSLTATIGGTEMCNPSIPGGGATHTCQVTFAAPGCQLGNRDYTVQPRATPEAALDWMFTGCAHTVLIGPDGTPTNVAPVQVADVCYYAAGTFDGSWESLGPGGGCGVTGSFIAIRTCPAAL
jgi:hypothetical protein